MLCSKNNISCNSDKELQAVPDDQDDFVHYPEDVPTTGEQQLPQRSEQTDETVQDQQSVQSDSRYPNTKTVREDTNPEQGTLDFNVI